MYFVTCNNEKNTSSFFNSFFFFTSPYKCIVSNVAMCHLCLSLAEYLIHFHHPQPAREHATFDAICQSVLQGSLSWFIVPSTEGTIGFPVQYAR